MSREQTTGYEYAFADVVMLLYDGLAYFVCLAGPVYLLWSFCSAPLYILLLVSLMGMVAVPLPFIGMLVFTRVLVLHNPPTGQLSMKDPRIHGWIFAIRVMVFYIGSPLRAVINDHMIFRYLFYRGMGATGTGGTGINSDYGIRLQNGRISAVNGAIILTGIGNGTGTSGRGISVDSSSVVESTGNATVSLTGTGTLSGLDSYGVRITRGGIVRTVNGALTIMGTGGGSGTSNYGVGVDFSSGAAGLVRSTGAGTITIVGVGGTGTDNNGGIIVGDVSSITSVSGAVDLQGTGHGSGTGNYGIVLVAGAKGESTGAAALTLTGTGAAGAYGIADTGAVSTIGGALATGSISLTSDLINLATIAVQTSGAGAIDIPTGGALAVDQALSANGTGAVTLTATEAITGLGGIGSGGILTLTASSVGTLATPLTLTALTES